MITTYILLIILEVLSVRIPGVDVKLMYVCQAMMVPLFILTMRNKITWPGTRRTGNTFLKIQCLLLISVLLPLLSYSQPSERTLSYTAGLALWVFCFAILVARVRIPPVKFFRVYLFSVFALLTVSVPSYFFLSQQRLSSLFGGATNRLGLYAVIGILVSYYIFSRKIDLNKYKFIYLYGALLCTLSLALTFSRSAALALLLTILEHNLRNKTIKLSQIAIVFTLVLGSVLYLNHIYVQTGDPRILKLMVRFGVNELFGHQESVILTASSRLVHYQNAWELATQDWKTFLFGAGLESYRSISFLTNSRGSELALHSLYLQYMVGGGMLALGLLLSHIIFMMKICYSLTKQQTDLCCFFLIPAIIHAAFQPAIFSRELLIFGPILLLSCKHVMVLQRQQNRT